MLRCLYPIFLKDAPEECRTWALELRVSVADAYLGWALMLCERARIGRPQEGALQDYWQRLRARPALAECMALEQRLYREYA